MHSGMQLMRTRSSFLRYRSMTVSFRNSDGCRWNRSAADTSTACVSPVGGYSAVCGDVISVSSVRQACATMCHTFQACELLRQRLPSGSGSAHGALTRLRERLVLSVGIGLAVAQQVDVHRLRGQRCGQHRAYTQARAASLIIKMHCERRTSVHFFGLGCGRCAFSKASWKAVCAK